MLDRDRILQAVATRRDDLRRLGVKRLGLFGSFARDEGDPKSDLDFIVDLQPRSFDAYMDVKFLLEDLFDRHVDLVLIDKIKPRLRDRILAEAVDAA